MPLEETLSLDLSDALSQLNALDDQLQQAAANFGTSLGSIDLSNLTNDVQAAIDAASQPIELHADTTTITNDIDTALGNVDASSLDAALQGATDAAAGLGDAAGGAGEKTAELGAAAGFVGTNLKDFAGHAAEGVGQLGFLGTGIGKVTSELGKLGPEGEAAALGIGATIGVVAEGASKFLALTDQVRQFRDVSGGTAAESSKLVVALDELGISPQRVSLGLARLGAQIDAGKDHLAQYGIEVAKTKDGHTDLAATFENILTKLNQLPPSIDKNQLLFDSFGRRIAISLIPALNLGTERLQELFDLAEKRHEIFTDEDLSKALNFKISMTSLKDSLDALSIAIAKPAVPLLTNAFEGLAAVVTHVIDGVEFLKQKLDDLGNVPGLHQLGQAFDETTGHSKTLQKVIVDGALFTIAPPIGLIKGIVDIGSASHQSASKLDELNRATQEQAAVAQAAAEADAELTKELSTFDSNIDAVAGLTGAHIALQEALAGTSTATAKVATATKSAADRALELRQNQLSVAQAQLGVTDSIKKVADAQDKLNNIYVVTAAETKAIENAERSLESAQRSYKNSTDQVAQAQQNLADVTRQATAAEAAQAERDLERVRLDREDAQARLDAANEALVVAEQQAQRAAGRSPTVQAAAAKALDDATRAAERAQLDLADATDHVGVVAKKTADITDGTVGTAKQASDAQKALDSALQSQKDSAQQVVDAQKNLKDAQDATIVTSEQLQTAQEDLTRAQLDQQSSVLTLDKAQSDLGKTMDGTSSSAASGAKSATDLARAQNQAELAAIAYARQLRDAQVAQDALNGVFDTAADKQRIYHDKLLDVAKEVGIDSPLGRKLIETARLEAQLGDNAFFDIKVHLSQAEADKLNGFIGDINDAFAANPALGLNPIKQRIQAFATGTGSPFSGWAMVGEQGPELVFVGPRDQATVLSANQTSDVVNNGPQGGSTVTQHVTVNQVADDPHATAFVVANDLGYAATR